MPVHLDGHPVPGDFATVGDGFAAALAEADRTGRMVIEISLAGAPLDPDRLRAWAGAPLAGAVLDVLSIPPADLARATLAQVVDSLDDLEKSQAAAAHAIHIARLDEAMGHFPAILAGWESSRRALEMSAAMMGWDLSTLRVGPDEPPAAALPDSLAAALTELKRSIGAHDWAGVGDCLGHDLHEQAGRWRTLLAHLSRAQ